MHAHILTRGHLNSAAKYPLEADDVWGGKEGGPLRGNNKNYYAFIYLDTFSYVLVSGFASFPHGLNGGVLN